MYHRTYYQRSGDDGVSFTPPVEITGLFDFYRSARGVNWNVYALGPGHGIELNDGTLAVPVWIADGSADEHRPSVASYIFSEDRGTTWLPGEVIPRKPAFANMNETAIIQRGDGRLLFNSRNEGGGFVRAVTVLDGVRGQFGETAAEERLPDPICFGGMTRGRLGGGCAVVFTNCRSRPCAENGFRRCREKLTAHVSFDDGASCKSRLTIEGLGGYSDPALSADGAWLYCLYEAGRRKFARFARMNDDWLASRVDF